MTDKQGEIQKVGLPGLLHLIYLKGDETAVLDVIKEPIKKRFFFRRGVPVAASSNILNEVLGRLLMQEGIITQRQYEDSLEVVLKEKKRHGEVLMSMGLLTQASLDDFLALQLKRRLFRLFDWTEGSYRYIKTGIPASIPTRPFHPGSLILEGISLGFFPVASLKAALEGPLSRKARLVLEGGRYTLDDFHLNLQEKRFAESLDGSRTLLEAIDSSDLLRHRAESIALSLLVTDLLKDASEQAAAGGFVLEESSESQAPEVPVDSKLNAELLFMRARTSISKGEFGAAIATLREITNINPSEGEYWAWLGWAMYNEDASRIKEAESTIKDAIDLNNDIDSAWFFLGMISLAQSNTDWAKRAFETAVQKNPWNTEALAELRRLELRLIYRDAPREAFSAFGFKDDPFAAVPRKVYLSEVQAAALDTLLRAVRKKAGPVLLEGNAGTGKTTLLLELLKRLSGDKVLASVVLKPAGREHDFIREINRGLGCQGTSPTVKEELLSLGMRVSQNRIQGGSTVIIVDEAHRLSNGCLKLMQYLSRLRAMQILLSGEPSLAERLKAPEFQELNEKLSSRISLSDLTKEETIALLDTLLLKAERAEAMAPFSIGIDEADEIFEATHGNLGAIRREAVALLQRAFDELSAPEPQMAREAHPETAPDETPVADVTDTQPVEAPGEAPFAGAPLLDEALLSNEPEVTGHADFGGDEPVEKKAPEPAPQGVHKAPAAAPREPSHAERGQAADKAAKAPSKRPSTRIVMMVVLLVVAGLMAGSLIGQYWFGQPPVEGPQEPVPPRETVAPRPPDAGQVDQTAPADGSIEMAAPAEGSI